MRATICIRIVFGTICCRLALATFAVTAWVLWGQTQDPWGALLTIRLGDGLSREACEQERTNREKESSAPRMVSYSCLPDTVDPREGGEPDLPRAVSNRESRRGGQPVDPAGGQGVRSAAAILRREMADSARARPE